MLVYINPYLCIQQSNHKPVPVFEFLSIERKKYWVVVQNISSNSSSTLNKLVLLKVLCFIKFGVNRPFVCWQSFSRPHIIWDRSGGPFFGDKGLVICSQCWHSEKVFWLEREMECRYSRSRMSKRVGFNCE